MGGDLNRVLAGVRRGPLEKPGQPCVDRHAVDVQNVSELDVPDALPDSWMAPENGAPHADGLRPAHPNHADSTLPWGGRDGSNGILFGQVGLFGVG